MHIERNVNYCTCAEQYAYRTCTQHEICMHSHVRALAAVGVCDMCANSD